MCFALCYFVSNCCEFIACFNGGKSTRWWMLSKLYGWLRLTGCQTHVLNVWVFFSAFRIHRLVLYCLLCLLMFVSCFWAFLCFLLCRNWSITGSWIVKHTFAHVHSNIPLKSLTLTMDWTTLSSRNRVQL